MNLLRHCVLSTRRGHVDSCRLIVVAYTSSLCHSRVALSTRRSCCVVVASSSHHRPIVVVALSSHRILSRCCRHRRRVTLSTRRCCSRIVVSYTSSLRHRRVALSTRRGRVVLVASSYHRPFVVVDRIVVASQSHRHRVVDCVVSSHR